MGIYASLHFLTKKKTEQHSAFFINDFIYDDRNEKRNNNKYNEAAPVEPMWSREIIWPERWGRSRIYANQMGNISFVYSSGWFFSLLCMRNCDQLEFKPRVKVINNNIIYMKQQRDKHCTEMFGPAEIGSQFSRHKSSTNIPRWTISVIDNADVSCFFLPSTLH